MTRRLARPLVGIVLLIVCLNSLTFACAPSAIEAVFVFTVHPAYPLEGFARGEIGVVQPSFARSYLVVAYRYLANSPFNTTEQKALSELWAARLSNASNLGEDDWVKAWLDARQKVTGVSESPKIDVFRNREKPNEYETYLNCPKDSFDTAISTLNERLKKYGSDSPNIHSWIEGQDQVFANCASGQHIPTPLEGSTDKTLEADRNYQIAAAHFYATQFDQAKQDLERIAADSSSPWQSIAPYLIARTMVRKASVGPDETKKDSLTQAETQLQKILSEKKLGSTHAASVRLMDLVRLRLHPAERMHELAHALLTKTPNDHLKQDLWDYTVLLDGALESDQPADRTVAKDNLTTDDLSDWLATLQGNTTSDIEHSLSRWQSTHSLPWLVAALSKVDSKNSKVPELLREALAVKSNSPAFASARFQAVRLMMEAGRLDEARVLLDQLLKNNRPQFDSSSWNLLVGERMSLAKTLADFLTYAPKVPAALSFNDDGREIPSEITEVSEGDKALIGKPFFDEDAAKILNTQVPLDVLKEAALSQSVPTHLRRDLVQAVWIRSVLLSDFKTADELVPTLKSLLPAFTRNLDDFASVSQPDAKKFSGLYAWLKFPGIEPVVDVGIGRNIPLGEQDIYRDNWWCAAAITPPTEPVAEDKAEITSFKGSTLTTQSFLTREQSASGVQQWAALRKLGAMPNYLCRQVILWANKNPQDPRVPEALHLAVNSTRHGCTDSETGRWSKAAFDLLHRKYPNTTWAKKTPYWFKE